MSLGPLEILAIAIFSLIVFGPQRLPEIARTVGKALGDLRRMREELTSELQEGFDSAKDPIKSFPAPGPGDEE